MKWIVSFIIGFIVSFIVFYKSPSKVVDYDTSELDSLTTLVGDYSVVCDSLKSELEILKHKPVRTKIDTVWIIDIQDEIIEQQDSIIRHFELIKRIDDELLQGYAEATRQQGIIIKRQEKQINRKNRIWMIASLVEAGVIISLLL